MLLTSFTALLLDIFLTETPPANILLCVLYTVVYYKPVTDIS